MTNSPTESEEKYDASIRLRVHGGQTLIRIDRWSVSLTHVDVCHQQSWAPPSLCSALVGAQLSKSKLPFILERAQLCLPGFCSHSHLFLVIENSKNDEKFETFVLILCSINDPLES